jgi:hypothetical protein
MTSTDNPVATKDDPEAGDATDATRPPGFLKMTDVKDGGAPTYINDPHGDYAYGMPAFAAAMMALVRLLRHLGYPAAIWFVLVANRDVVPALVFALLSVRQGLHILFVLTCACVNPTFLLVDIGASMQDEVGQIRGKQPWVGGYTFLTMYAVAPEKFVALALFEKGGLNNQWLKGGRVVLCSALLDFCGLAALGTDLGAGNLTPVLARVGTGWELGGNRVGTSWAPETYVASKKPWAGNPSRRPELAETTRIRNQSK